MKHIEVRAMNWLIRNKQNMSNYLSFNKEKLEEFTELCSPASWIYERRYSLQYFIVGRDGAYSDELRELKDIILLLSKN